MKYEDLPEFAKPYKKKGYDVRKQKDNYFLYKISSHRVPGMKYPKLEQEYIGIIKQDGTLLEKKKYAPANPRYLEFGLSSFLYGTYKRRLVRSLFNCSGKFGECLAILAIVKYIFGTISETAIDSCFLSYSRKEEVLSTIPMFSEEMQQKLLEKIEDLQRQTLGDDRESFEIIMKLAVVAEGAEAPQEYPLAAMGILNKHGVKV